MSNLRLPCNLHLQIQLFSLSLSERSTQEMESDILQKPVFYRARRTGSIIIPNPVNYHALNLIKVGNKS